MGFLADTAHPLIGQVLWLLSMSAYYVALALNFRQIQIAWTRGTYKKQNTSTGIFLSNIGRFVVWVCIGTLLLPTKPMDGWLFILTRGVGACMMVVNLALKSPVRPPVQQTVMRVLSVAIALAAICVALHVLPHGDRLIEVFYWLSSMMFVYSFVEIVRQVWSILKSVRSGDFANTRGMTRRLQWGMLFNFVAHFLYGLVAQDAGLGEFMLWAYACISVPQAVLVVVIEYCIRRQRNRPVRAAESL